MALNIKGVDISYCQKGIDYSALAAAGVKFAIIRAGYSETADRLLDTHVRGCEAAGIDIGYYWYSYAKSVEDARREARACLKAIGGYARPKYPVFFDGEESAVAEAAGKTLMTDISLAFIEEIERGGYPSGLYSNPAWLENFIDKQRVVGKCDIWLAHWTNSADKLSRYDYGQVMWQWGTEKLGGVVVDGDICFIDYPAKTAEWYTKIDVGGERADSVGEITRIALEVIRGKWGNGAVRKRKLESAGFDYAMVQGRVNEILNGG